eukprot:g1790.t1
MPLPTRGARAALQLLLPLFLHLCLRASPTAGKVTVEVGVSGEPTNFDLPVRDRREERHWKANERRLAAPTAPVTGIRDRGAEDYLFKDQREHICAGVNEVRAHYHTVDYSTLPPGVRGEVCSTNGTELKQDIESGPDTLHVVLPKGREIDLSSVGSILIRQGQTVHLRANNGSTSINGGNATRHFVVHGSLVAQDLVFINGNSRSTAGGGTSWTEPPVNLGGMELSGGSIRLRGGRSSARLVGCTFYNNNMHSSFAGRDIWSEGELALHDVNFAPGWDNAPQPVRNDGHVEVFPSDVWDMGGVAMRL